MAKDGIKLKDLATKAGVSPSTVSLVLNKRECRVSENTRKRILDLAKEYSYYPHGVARSLVTSRTQTLGFLILDITNPFFTGIARGIEDRALDFGYSVIFCSSDDSKAQENRLLNMLRSCGVDGLIVAHTADTLDASPVLEDISTPLVLIYRYYDMPHIAGHVLIDNYSGAREAVNYLLELGHLRIACLGGPSTARSAQDRFRAYRDALSEAGISLHESFYSFDSYTLQAGERMMSKLLDKGLEFSWVLVRQ